MIQMEWETRTHLNDIKLTNDILFTIITIIKVIRITLLKNSKQISLPAQSVKHNKTRTAPDCTGCYPGMRCESGIILGVKTGLWY